MSTVLESQWNVDSNDILCVRKYSQLFMHKSNTFLLKIRPLKPLGQWGKQPQNPLLLLEPCGPPMHTWMPGPTPLTMPNNSLIVLCTSTQLRNNGPIGYNGMPCIHPQNCPLPFDASHPSNTPIPWPPPLTTPKSIQIYSAILPQYTLWTDRPTDRWSKWMFRTMSAYAREWCTNNYYYNHLKLS